jgi:hypothetical protein
MTTTKNTVDRREFLRRLHADCDIPYGKAIQVYDCVNNIIADAIVNGSKIKIGTVMSIKPTWSKPRAIHMGFKNEKNQTKKASRIYYKGRSLKFKVNVYKDFMSRCRLNWFSGDERI